MADPSPANRSTSPEARSADSTAGDAPAEGSAVWFRPDPARALLYDTASGLRVPATAVQPEMAS